MTEETTGNETNRSVIVNPTAAASSAEGENISTKQADRLVKLGNHAAVPDILQGLGAEQASILTSYRDRLSALAEQRELPAGGYLEDLPEDVRAKKLLDTKIKEATEARAQVKGQYEEVTKAAHVRLEERKEILREELFGDVDTSTTLTVALADNDKIEELVKVAIRSGSNGLGLAKALLPTIHDRGLDELSMPILKNYPTLEASWREWQALPEAEVLARQTDPGRIEQVIPEVSVDRLQVRPRAQTY